MDTLIEKKITPSISNAIAEWASILDTASIKFETDSEFNTYQQTTFKYDASTEVVLFPSSESELIKIIEIANKYTVPIYPISKGRNIGLGSKVPIQGTAVVVDLSKMNQIISFDNNMGYVKVQPGVTFDDMHQFLISQNSTLMLNVSGGPPDGSLVGNALDRGHGFGPQWDRFKHISEAEIILANGQKICTGFSKYSNTELGFLSASCSGPQILDLFAQSNLGIVSSLTFLLNRKPEFYSFFSFTADSDKNFVDALSVIREIKLSGLDVNFHTFNKYRFLAMNDSKVEHFDTILANTFSETAKWTVFGGIYGQTSGLLKEKQRMLTRAFANKKFKIHVITKTKANLLWALRKPISLLTGENIEEKLNLAFFSTAFLGNPTTKGLNMCYFKNKKELKNRTDPDKDQCGVLWYSPLVPNIPEKIIQFLEVINTVVSKYGFEPNLGLLCLSARTIDITGAIIFDRNDSAETELASKCIEEITIQCNANGFYPYRAGLSVMPHLPSNNPTDQLIRTIKSIVDPNKIISPGKYGI